MDVDVDVDDLPQVTVRWAFVLAVVLGHVTVRWWRTGGQRRELPALLVLPTEGSADYCNWIVGETGGGGAR